MVNIGEMMNKAIMDGMLQAIIIFMPYIISFLTTALVVWVIKKIIEKFTYDFSTISGDSRSISGNVSFLHTCFRLCIHGIQPAVCTMLRSNGCYQA